MIVAGTHHREGLQKQTEKQAVQQCSKGVCVKDKDSKCSLQRMCVVCNTGEATRARQRLLLTDCTEMA